MMKCLSNELYRVAFIDPDSPLNERVAEFLRVLRLTDLDMYHRLHAGGDVGAGE